MQHPDLTYASARSIQAARQRAAEERRKAHTAQAATDDEELPAQLLVAWMHLAGACIGEPAIIELRGVRVACHDELMTAPASGDAA